MIIDLLAEIPAVDAQNRLMRIGDKEIAMSLLFMAEREKEVAFGTSWFGSSTAGSPTQPTTLRYVRLSGRYRVDAPRRPGPTTDQRAREPGE